MKKQTAWDNYVKIAADFETTYHKEFDNSDFLAENKDTGDHLSFTPNESSQVFLAGAMEFETKEYRLSYESIPDFIDNCVAMIAKQGKKRGLVYFHNLAYDGDYILKWLLKNGYRQSININEQTHKPKLTYKEFALLKSGGKFFSLELWWRGIYIKFLDSLKLFPVKLENLGELIGAKKLKDTVD